MMHPGQPFKGQIVINAHKDIDFKIIRKVMMASAEAGYTAINYAVLTSRKGGEAAAGGGTGG
jgi:biopolymer transport protein ExbD